ncbi:hypothetical protein PAXRUDRAFT_824739 [Paxillus rubicundulus Ve08.2h10]|uniref:Uncharacterized protein n=1 Tax=Paxillus rubicundulus Ve08.2h10 TaxID=930991 RepID=A0A0D0E7D7_9AGAM|nr:hypothetical protein PAXRUDRAFT_824739 [Paxillus rubicundulus Ve08.2h10]
MKCNENGESECKKCDFSANFFNTSQKLWQTSVGRRGNDDERRKNTHKKQIWRG